MEKSIEDLIAKYNEGLADPQEIRMIEQMIEDGLVDLTQLRELTALEEQIGKTTTPAPSMNADDAFYQMLAKEKKQNRPLSIQLPRFDSLYSRLAFAASFLLAGFMVGYWMQRPSATPEVKELTAQVGELKEMMMLSLLENESATERLKAVSLTGEMNQASSKVTQALLQTLNYDPSINVRLSALDALSPYVKEPEVREQLIRSIAKQESPLVQVALAELMAAIHEKKSVTELQKIIDNDNTPRDVKGRIRKSIEVLI